MTWQSRKNSFFKSPKKVHRPGNYRAGASIGDRRTNAQVQQGFALAGKRVEVEDITGSGLAASERQG
jgi:hypothetical protein